jgi:hypothetical protein
MTGRATRYQPVASDHEGVSGGLARDSSVPDIRREEYTSENGCATDDNLLMAEQTGPHWWPVALFGITTCLLYGDQNLMAPNLTAIAHDFHIDSDIDRDTMLGGRIAMAFFLLGAPASLLVGCLIDSRAVAQMFPSYHRTLLFAIVVLVGEGACFATYFARTYNMVGECP